MNIFLGVWTNYLLNFPYLHSIATSPSAEFTYYHGDYLRGNQRITSYNFIEQLHVVQEIIYNSQKTQEKQMTGLRSLLPCKKEGFTMQDPNRPSFPWLSMKGEQRLCHHRHGRFFSCVFSLTGNRASTQEGNLLLDCEIPLDQLLVAIMAPSLVAIADYGSYRKLWLYFLPLGAILTAPLVHQMANWPLAVTSMQSACRFSGTTSTITATSVASKSVSISVPVLGYSLDYIGGGFSFWSMYWCTFSYQIWFHRWGGRIKVPL